MNIQGHNDYYLSVLLFSVLLLLSVSARSDTDIAISTGSGLPINLRYEPIQPLLLPEKLNPGKVVLGDRLFHDPRLGRDNAMSCSSCHNLENNGANHRSHTLGRNGIELNVNTLTVFNSSLNHKQFWDGRAKNLREQINFVVASSKEFATSWPDIINKLKKDKHYPGSFQKLYTDGITAQNIRDAIISFERTLITANSRFDQYLLGNTKAITPEEKLGYRLFKAYGCVACHQGRNVGGNLFMKFGVFGDYFKERGNLTKADLGRYNITGNNADRYVFRVPSLRLATLTSPYFHDGSVTKLTEAVKIMAKHQLGRIISDQDINHIIAFLKTLPGNYKGQLLGNKHTTHFKGNK